MIFRFGTLFLITAVIALTAVVGCSRTQDMVADTPSAADTTLDETMTAMEMETPVKIVWLINVPEGGAQAYNDWVATISETLLAPEELLGIKSYRNATPDARPHLYSELMFNSFLDAATYLNRPEIAVILQDQVNYTSAVSQYTFIQRSDYAKDAADAGVDLSIKVLLVIDYPVGGKQAYLDWAASVSTTLIEPSELRRVGVYENYYGASPQRLVVLEFANQADADTFEELETIIALEAELDNRAGRWEDHTFEWILPDM